MDLFTRANLQFYLNAIRILMAYQLRHYYFLKTLPLQQNQ